MTPATELTDRQRKIILLCAAEGAAPEAIAAILSLDLPTVARCIQTAGMSPRERDVYRLAVRGLAPKEIATILCIAPKTVSFHMDKIYRKTGARGRVPLLLHAIKTGFIRPEEICAKS